MENRYQHTLNGQSVLEEDLNLLGETSALADDRVFAELFRMTPYDGSTVRKGVLPSGHDTSGRMPLVAGNGATGSVLVNPFRAFIGSRAAVATDAKKNWRDVRSAISIGSTALGQQVSFAANSSGNPRWDLVYASITVDGNAASVTRKKKDPTTKVISAASVVTQLATSAALAVQQGTAAASPTWPAVPADSGGVYRIPIAYVQIPNGFGASSTVTNGQIAAVAPVVRMNVAGFAGPEPANCHFTSGSSCLTTAKVQAWGSSGTKPPIFLPSGMSGGQQLLIYLDLATGSETHASGAIVDTRDWRNRFVKWSLVVAAPGATVPWLAASAGTIPAGRDHPTSGSRTWTGGIDHTFVLANAGANHSIFQISGTELATMDDAATLDINVTHNDNGALRVLYTGTPNAAFFLWLEFSGRLDNEV